MAHTHTLLWSSFHVCGGYLCIVASTEENAGLCAIEMIYGETKAGGSSPLFSCGGRG